MASAVLTRLFQMMMGKQPMIIREAQPDDAEELADIYLDSANRHLNLDRNLYKIPNRNFVLDRFTRWIERLTSSRLDGVIFVAEISDKVVGYVGASFLSKPEESSMLQGIDSIDIDLSVIENSRRRGVGTALMRAMEEWAKERGFSRITLNTHISNDDAIRFYQERHGYRPIGLVMEKSLHS